ncbi:excalibur calcium-binding domain-containing protein [Asanoa sp. NPDC049573]|uniref:excalibur calcium-binding domain-containing protein n=1 Tax=Asanoa sp. NPDC049573 TaxID=3155396 RepID=UPI00343E1EEE
MNPRASGCAALLAALALNIGGCGSDGEGTAQRAPTTAPASPTSVFYASCGDAERAGTPTIRKGEPGYREGLDLDGDGIACAVATAQAMPIPATAPTLPELGQKQTTALGDATVYAVRFPVTAQDETATAIRTAGMQFAVADIKVCSNGTVDSDGYTFDYSDFTLVASDDTAFSFWNVQVGARSPNLTDTLSSLNLMRAGSCRRGWLTFEVPPKTKLKAVEYTSSGGVPLVWAAS